jgi:hypothetical protein
LVEGRPKARLLGLVQVVELKRLVERPSARLVVPLPRDDLRACLDLVVGPDRDLTFLVDQALAGVDNRGSDVGLLDDGSEGWQAGGSDHPLADSPVFFAGCIPPVSRRTFAFAEGVSPYGNSAGV